MRRTESFARTLACLLLAASLGVATIPVPAQATGSITFAPGPVGPGGCPSLTVLADGLKVARVPSVRAARGRCARLVESKRIGDLVYLVWAHPGRASPGGRAAPIECGGWLWVTDGTSEGTARVHRLEDPLCHGTHLRPEGWLLIFSDQRGVHGTRGTPPTLIDIGFLPAGFLRVGPLLGTAGELVFAAPPTSGGPDVGRELWATDGTRVRLVRDIRPGPDGSDPRSFVGLLGVVLFIADDGTGPAWWTTDGTVDGTRRLLPPVAVGDS